MSDLDKFLAWLDEQKQYKVCSFWDSGSEYDSCYEPITALEAYQAFLDREALAKAKAEALRAVEHINDVSSLKKMIAAGYAEDTK